MTGCPRASDCDTPWYDEDSSQLELDSVQVALDEPRATGPVPPEAPSAPPLRLAEQLSQAERLAASLRADDSVVARRRGRVSVLEGQAGCGKTAQLALFAAHTLPGTARVVQVAAAPFGEKKELGIHR